MFGYNIRYFLKLRIFSNMLTQFPASKWPLKLSKMLLYLGFHSINVNATIEKLTQEKNT